MAILQNTPRVTPHQIIEAFPPFNDPDFIKGIIIGNDLDSLLSACLLKFRYNWDVVGIYNLEKIWYNQENPEFIEKLLQGKYLAVDLDIYHPSIFSIGHHIETMTRDDLIPGHLKSLNPNLIRGIHNREFNRKYPLGTIHFLTWILQETRNLTQESKEIIWLADSSYINGQSHKYRPNVSDWLENFFSDPIFLQHFNEIDEVEFEILVRTLVEKIRATGIHVSRGQVGSRHLNLRGGQCQFSNPSDPAIGRMLNLICSITHWRKPEFPLEYTQIQGARNTDSTTNTITRGRLDQFLAEEGVFSYAIPNQGKINYTNGFPFI